MIRFLLTFGFFILATISWQSYAMAQSEPDQSQLEAPTEETSPPLEHMPMDLPPELPGDDIDPGAIIEAEQFEDYCHRTPKFEKYYNCECLAAKFLDKRLELGPDVGRTNVMFAIQDECLDATDAAGSFYSTCVGNSALLPANIPIEEYCTCFANEYAKMYENAGRSISSRLSVDLQTAAHMRCRKRR